ncbi:amidase [Paramixta manurensis]|uniref:Amidase n=1 Tax=Paramixta manurensis TaxID=2740817 RepID=A0A6M8UEI1_9GAMM|nr:amidase [Erwiniaceae bacterium PD-1]
MISPSFSLFDPAFQQAARIQRREISAVQLVEAHLEQIARHNPHINAVVILLAEQALEQAWLADKAQETGQALGPLHGVPITVKESWDVAGLPSTFGLPHLRDNIAGNDALAVTRLKQAGAILLGKTNVPPNLADWQTCHPDYGATLNPWDNQRTPGGSSGGSAAALACGFSALEIGSDIGGSIRMPAHYCGVWGHKPGYGVIPGRGHAQPGHVAPADISVFGPLSRSAGDLRLALDLLAQPDPHSWPRMQAILDDARPRHGTHFRVALWNDDPHFPVSSEIRLALEQAGESLRRAGIEVVDTVRPAFSSRESYEVYVQLLRAATSGRQSDEAFSRHQQLRDNLVDDDASYRALLLRGNVLSHRQWLALNQQRYRLMAAWQAFFDQVDFLLCPVASTAAFPLFNNLPKEDRYLTVDGRTLPSANDYFWLGLASACGLPATTVPLMRTATGLPVGAQIIGRSGADRACIALAEILEHHHYRFAPPPLDAAQSGLSSGADD